jgi:hypothetical protein
MWRVVVCDQETPKTRRLKPATGLWKIQPQWVVRPGKQTNNWFVGEIFVNPQQQVFYVRPLPKSLCLNTAKHVLCKLFIIINILLL